MKNMLMICATKLTFPIATKRRAIPPEIRVAFSGSWAGPRPRARKALALTVGRTRSRARACSVRGATRIDPTADEMVAAPSPIGMIGPHRAIFDMII
jgi:hypothetical protein